MNRSFTLQQISTILAALGSDPPLQTSGGALVFQTICHNPPHTGSHKLFYYPESERFHCYTQCGDTFDLYELVQRSRLCNFAEALLFIESALGISSSGSLHGFASAKQDELDALAPFLRFSEETEPEEEEPTVIPPQSLIEFYSPVSPVEWQREGITPEACEHYHICADVSKNEVIIPHYDRYGKLVGIRSRTFSKERLALGMKYMPTILQGTQYAHPLRYHLYGLHEAENAIRKAGKIMLCESEKACLQGYSFYGDNNFVTAVCGSSVSLFQRDLVLSLGVREVFLALDKEYEEYPSLESDRYADKILRLAALFSPFVRTYVLYDTTDLLRYKDSPTDQGKKTLEILMRNKFEVHL